VRRKTRSIAAAREALTRTLGRTPDAYELASQLGVDAPTLWRWMSDVEGAVHVPLDAGASDRDEAFTFPAAFLGTGDETAEDRLAREEDVARLREAMLELREQERTVLSLYYFEELKAREIAAVMGVSESRISQIRSKALGQLRQALAPLAASA
jgi:RNA polymerase sigma factor for flagellar operon FliA